MKCGCGADFEIVEEFGGVHLRCKNYDAHKDEGKT